MLASFITRTSPRAIALIVSTLCLLTTVVAQKYPDSGDAGTGGNNTILGNVFLPSGQRPSRPIRIRLLTPTRGDMTSMTTDDGSFSFRRLATGNYTVVIDGEPDYEPVSQGVYIVQAVRNAPPGVFTVSIKLKLKSSTGTAPAVVDSRLANVPQKALDAYNKGLELGKRGNTKAAIEQLKQAILEYQDFMLAYNELGVQYLKINDLDKAEESLRKGLSLGPDAFELLVNHGIALVRLRKFAEAEPELRAALKQREQSPVVHLYLGRDLAYLGQFEEAEKELGVAIKLGGDEMHEAHRYLAGVYNGLGDHKRAISELETYLKLEPKSKDADQVRELIKSLKEADSKHP